MPRPGWFVAGLVVLSAVASATPPPITVAQQAAAAELVVRGRAVKTHVVRVSDAVSYAIVEVAVTDTWKAGIAPGLHPGGAVVIAVVTTEARAQRALQPEADVLLFLRGAGPYLFSEIADGGFVPASDEALKALGPAHRR